MHPKIEAILERPTSHKVLILIVSVILVGGLCYQLLLSDQLKQHAELTEAVEKLDFEITKEQQLASKLEEAKRKLKDLEAKFSVALQQLPDKSEIDNILEKISNLARESGLELNIFKRREENFREFFVEVPVSVSVTGQYHQVATFFDEVGRLPRTVNINQISLTEPKVASDTLMVKVEFLLTAFRFLSEQERAAREPEDKKRRK